MTARSVLIADDSRTVRALVRLQLEQVGYQVSEAVDGLEALHLATTTEPDVVLLDIEMPGKDGYEVLHELKADPKTQDIPVVFLTGRTDSDDIVSALDAGAHDYLAKPPSTGELLARVAAAMRVKTLQDELRQRLDEVDHLSRTDVLTDLYNRRHMQEHLEQLRSGARRHGYPLAVLIIDIDHFKTVNDRHGHAIGDAVLRSVAHCLNANTRGEDILGRWGGEEFLVLMPQTDSDGAMILAERLRHAVNGLSIPLPDGQDPLAVTISLGGASAYEVGPHDLLAAADAQLYAAKADGRDQSRITQLEPSGDPELTVITGQGG